MPQTAGKRPKVSDDTEDCEDDCTSGTAATPVKRPRWKAGSVGGSQPADSGSKQKVAAGLQIAASSGSSAKLAKELDASEKVSLGITQMLKKVEDDAQFSVVTQKTFASHLSKVEGRLTPELSILYTQGYDGTNATPGVHMYEELEKQRKKMKSIEGLIRSFAATEGVDSSADALNEEQHLATAAGVNVAPIVRTTVSARGFKECLDAKKYSECAEILDKSSDHVYSVKHMPSCEQAEALQSQLLLVNIVSLLKAGTEVAKDNENELKAATHAATGILSELLKAMNERGCAILDKAMDHDIKRLELLVPVVTARAHVSEETLAKAEARPCYG